MVNGEGAGCCMNMESEELKPPPIGSRAPDNGKPSCVKSEKVDPLPTGS